MDFAGLIYDESRHYIDHLAPFCSLMGWPLMIYEPMLAEETRRFYPELEVIEAPFLKLPKVLITCDPQPIIDAVFPMKKIKTIWLPHGNSDKGRDRPFFEALQKEDIALVYGQKMLDFMHEKKVLSQTIRVGNFRWEYFLKNQKGVSFPKKKRTFLYAPTWDEDNSFWKHFPELAKNLPKDCRLLVKLHPNTLQKEEAKLQVWIGRFACENIFFLPNDPPIYPILAEVDGYIGDMSSIGYDFLRFDRPLFFLNFNPDLPLHQVGAGIEPKNFTFELKDTLSSKRLELYRYTFDPMPNPQHLKRQIYARCGL